jgi:UDP-N-acetylglucosamine 4,6-dehydratase
MTRFWITLEKGVLFVIKSFQRMKGGEIFVPKSPSVRITDVAKAFAPKIKIKYVGIRPGEKINEVLCPVDSSYLTIEFNDHYIIEPSIDFSDTKKNLKINALKEKGRKVSKSFEYNSANNTHFLKVEEIKKYI